MSSKPKNRPGRPKTVDRQCTIELAMVQYWREGVHSLSLNEVCRRTGISKPALYREFGGEDGLMDEALELYREKVVAPLLSALTSDVPFAELVEMIIVGMTADRDMPAGCLFTEMRFSRSRLGPATDARLLSIEQSRRKNFKAWYLRALSRGEVDASISPALAARYIDTQITTALVLQRAGESPELIREQARLALSVLSRTSSSPCG